MAGVALALAMVACSGGGGGGDEGRSSPTFPTTTTTRPAETTTTADPREDAFRRGLSSALDGEDAADVEAFLGAARSICLGLASARGVAGLQSSAIDLALSGNTPDDVMATVLRTAGKELCPDSAAVIDAELAKRGL